MLNSGTDHSIPSAATPENSTSALIDYTALNQAVLKIVNPADQTVVGQVISERCVEAMQRLVDIIDRLRSPHSGWSSELPKTPETIAPYVVEEVYDVLDTLQAQQDSSELPPSIDQPLWHGYCLVRDVAPQLLWAIARSGYEVMRLLEGIPAQIFQPEQGWQSGILRLTATLQMTHDDGSWSLDLATHQAAQTLVGEDVMIQAREYDFCREPTWVTGLLQGIVQHIQATTSPLTPLIEGIAVHYLVPSHPWRSGTLQLLVGFSVTILPILEPLTGDRPLLAAPPATPVATNLSSPVVRFTDMVWLDRYIAVVKRQQLANILPYLQSLQQPTDPSDAMVRLLRDTCEIADLLQSSLTLSCRNFPQQDWSLDELGLRLLWCISRSSYEVMQLMGGVQALLLCPKGKWESGLLRLQVSLIIQTPEVDWQLDLVTGHSPIPGHRLLEGEAIAQSSETIWCQTAILINDLAKQVREHIHQATPEVQLFLDGTCTDLCIADQPWQPGTIQLTTDFEFHSIK